MRNAFTRLRREQRALQHDVRERISGYLATALGLVAGLAWNDAIRTAIEQLFPLQHDSLVAKFGYAVLMTIVVVLLTMYLVRFIRRSNEPASSK